MLIEQALEKKKKPRLCLEKHEIPRQLFTYV